MKLGGPSLIVDTFSQRALGYGTGSSGGSITPPLDSVSSDLGMAYSIGRRLLTSYTGPLIRVRVDNEFQSEEDIPYVEETGLLDLDYLLNFAGSDACYVCKAYGQVGGRNWQQTTAAAQPLIVEAGGGVQTDEYGRVSSVVTHTTNLVHSGTNQTSIFGSSSSLIVMRMKQISPFSGLNRVLYNGTADLLCYAAFGSTIYWDYGNGSAANNRVNAAQPTGWANAYHWLRLSRHADVQKIHVDGTELVSATRTAALPSTSAFLYAPLDLTGCFSECVAWTSGDNAAAKEAALMA